MPGTKRVLPRERADRDRVLRMLRKRPDKLIFDKRGIDKWLAKSLDLTPVSVVELLRHMVSDGDICRLTAKLRLQHKTKAASTVGIALPEAEEALDAKAEAPKTRRVTRAKAQIEAGGYRQLSP